MGSFSPGGGLSSSSSATSGDAKGLSGSGNKIFNIGGNPNVGQATSALENTLSNPFVILGVIGIIWLVTKKKRK